MYYVSNWCVFACSCSSKGLVLPVPAASSTFLSLLLSFSITFYYKLLSFVWYNPQFFKFLGPFVLYHFSCLFLFLCVYFSVIDQCVSQPFSLTLLKLTFLILGLIDTHLARTAVKTRLGYGWFQQTQLEKGSIEEERDFSGPVGAWLVSQSTLGCRESWERERKREMPQYIPALQIMFQLEASQHSHHRPLSGSHSTGNIHTCSSTHLQLDMCHINAWTILPRQCL